MPTIPTILSSLPSRKKYAAVPSAPTSIKTESNPMTTLAPKSPALVESSLKTPYTTEDGQQWPSSPLPPQVVKANVKLKKRIRIMRVCHRVCLTVLAITVTALEGQTLAVFIRTKDVQRNGRGPWAKETSLWPSILLLSTSATTALVGLMVLFSYMRSIKLANTLAVVNATIIITTEVAGFVTWIVVAILYRTGRTGKDLWGWACSPGALSIQPNFDAVLNFDGICQKGQTNWGLAIASALTNFLSIAVWFFVYQRRKYQKIQKTIEAEEKMRVEALGRTSRTSVSRE